MAQIPFPPGGPQVQAALQNPVRFPDQRLQQYAQGQQPTGQVPPPMAANELTIRNAQRQAASRQSAMQNNPQNSPTIFQQKDAEIAQARAAMQQAQQKEQQLGVIGALMAKKAQDLQAREAMGVAQLPVNPNMFTAMHGGVVFNDGGRVQRFNGQGGSKVTLGGKTWEELSAYEAEPAASMGELISGLFSRGGKKRNPRTGEPITLGEFLRLAEQEDIRVPSTVGEPEPTIYAKEPKKEENVSKRTSPSSEIAVPEKKGLPSLPQASSYFSQIGSIPSVNTNRSDELVKEQLSLSKQIETAINSGQMSEAEGKRIMQEYMAERTKIQEAYAKDRGARQEEIKKAMEGKKPDFLSGIVSGLPSGAGLPGGPRVADVLAGAAKGLAGQQSEYEKRLREASIEDAKTKQLFAQADKEFALGNIEAGNKFLKEAREEKAKAGDRAARALQARSEGLSADLAQVVRGETAARDLAKTEYTTKADLLGRQMTGDIQLRLAEFGADREERLANIKEKFIRTRDPEMIVLAKAMGVDPKELFMTRYGSKRGSGQKFSDPAKALETVQALPFNDPLLINYAGLSSDEMMKLGRVKGFGELPLETQKKITRAREILRAQLTTGVVPSHLLSGDED